MAWSWQNGVAELVPYDSNKVDRKDCRVRLRHSQNGQEEIVKRIGPNEEYRTLGAYISVSGEYGTQLKVLRKKTRDWVYRIRNSILSGTNKFLAYNMFLLPQVLYATPCMMADPVSLQRIHRPALEMSLNALNVNRNYPRAL